MSVCASAIGKMPSGGSWEWEGRCPARFPAGRRGSADSFRHARISELLQLYGIDPLTVAGQSGTSLAMIERANLRSWRVLCVRSWRQFHTPASIPSRPI
jgi:hypothetical protein